ncbi:MAG: short-chain dehydrogenase [Ignavibacteria bacterium]|nr:short-chain dehydrogenase [Ignavibacteria bacterium]
MSHALIIGGTGMLSKVTEYLAGNYDTVSVICRNKRKIDSNLKNINPLILDYSYYKFLTKNLQSAVEKFGNIELVVSWIHSTAPLAPNIIAEKINSFNVPFRFFDILGSAYANPSLNTVEREEKLNENKNLKYRKIVLGFKLENNSSRWLTNEEISSGVIETVKSDAVESIIGVVSPWDKRP